MSYYEIFTIGWSLNVLMFFINLLVAIRTFSSGDMENIYKENMVLKDLKEELDKYYPNKTLETFIAYSIPFTAFFKTLFRFIEMYFFFQKNSQARIFDYIVYKYKSELEKVKNKS